MSFKAYKITDKNSKCKGFLFEEGKRYKHYTKLEIHKSGFHFCRNLVKCFNYYEFNSNNIIYEVRVYGNVVGYPDDIECTDDIKIIKKIEWNEVLNICNSGKCNFGNQNSGDQNSGNRNSGNRNSGNQNSGNDNPGSFNSGNSNHGNGNSGSRNLGNRNSGNWNLGNENSGDLNTNNPDKIRVFNKWISKEEYSKIYFPAFFYFSLNQWVSYDIATLEEKRKYKKEIELHGGFVKILTYKEAWMKSWKNSSKEDRIKVKDIPGFTKELFFEISGIDVDKD